MEDHDKVVLFSGRFDRPHCGHIRTIQLLGQRFKKVIVVVLDYKKQHFPVGYRVQILRDILNNSKGEYEVVANLQHFARITKEELKRYKFDIYAAGNLEVLKHIDSIGFDTIWVDRPYEYNANNDRFAEKVKTLESE